MIKLPPLKVHDGIIRLNSSLGSLRSLSLGSPEKALHSTSSSKESKLNRGILWISQVQVMQFFRTNIMLKIF